MKIEEFRVKYVNTVGWNQERLDACEEYERENPCPDINAGFGAYQRWYKGLERFMNNKGWN